MDAFNENTATTVVKRPKDMTPEEYLLHKKNVHRECMKRYLDKHPEKRSKQTPEQKHQIYLNYRMKDEELFKEKMRNYMKVYMREYSRKERARLNEIRELIKKKELEKELEQEKEQEKELEQEKK